MADNRSTSGSPILSSSSGSPGASIDPNSSIIHKVRSRMSSILPTTLTSWFSPSGRNGRRRRSNDSDDSVIDAPQTAAELGDSNGTKATGTSRGGVTASSSTLTRAPATWVVGVPPMKRQKFVASTDELSFARDISHIPFTYSTPAPNSAALGKRRTLGDATSTPYHFTSTATPAASGSSSSIIAAHQVIDGRHQAAFAFAGQTNRGGRTTTSAATATNVRTGTLNGDETTEDEDVDTQRPRITAAAASSSSSAAAKRASKPDMWLEDDEDDDDEDDDDEDDDADDDDDDEVDLELNGLAHDESASESGDRFGHKQRKPVAATRSGRSQAIVDPQLVGRRTVADSPTLGNGLGIAAGGGGGPLNFNAHLQTHKSLFSTPNNSHGNRSASLNASTTSLNSLSMLNVQRRPALYGSTSALSDSRLLSGGGGIGSPFYNGRTMYGGASAYSTQRRAQSSQRTLRVPTQMRPASSLSGASSSRSTTNLATATTAAATGGGVGSSDLAGAGLQTSALSNTAKRILDLMNQFSTPLGDVRKMPGGPTQQMLGTNGTLPALVAHRLRFDESDMLANRGVRLQRPQTPYTRQVPVVQPQQQPQHSAMATQLQVPTMSTLMQMKKVLQNKTERVRELATASNSILNDTQPGVYTLPVANEAAVRSLHNAIDTNAATTIAAVVSNATGNASVGGADTKRKMRNKITSTRTSTRNAHDDELPEPVHLPSVSFPLATNAEMPVFNMGVPFGKSAPGPVCNDVVASAKASTKFDLKTKSSVPATASFKNQSPSVFAGQTTTKTSTTASSPTTPPTTGTAATFKFSAPLAVIAPAFASSLDPISTFTFSPPLNVLTASATNCSFQFGSSTKQAHTTQTAAAALPLKTTGSVLDALQKPRTAAPIEPQSLQAAGLATSSPAQLPSLSQMFAAKSTGAAQWECDSCMLRNDASRTKCVACETDRHKATAPVAQSAQPFSAASTFSTFGTQFAAAANTWECNACLVRNKTDATKCVSCTTAKPAAVATVVVASPSVPSTFGAQFAPAASTWECNACMVRNQAAAAKCVACETGKPAAAAVVAGSSSSSSLAAQFKPSASTWECDACMVRNNAAAASCVACTTPKPGAAAAKPLGHAFSAPSAFAGATTTTQLSSVDSGFASLVAKQSAKWECAACLMRNDAQRKKCECCELDKPGASTENNADTATTTGSPAMFGNSAAGRSIAAASGSFSFGVPFDAKAAAPTALLKPLQSAPTSSFTFGTLPSSAPITTLTQEVSQNAKSTAPDSSGSPQPTVVKPVTKSDGAAVPAFGGFAFGSAATSLTKPDATPKASFLFGSNNDNKPASTISATTTTTAIQGIKRTVDFSFGSPNSLASTKKVENAISFGSIKPADEADAPSASEIAKLPPVNGGFSFGSSIAPKPAASTLASFSTSSAPAAATLLFGSVSSTASSTPATTAPPTATAPALHFGSDPIAAATKSTAPSFVFGSAATNTQPAAASSALTFGSEIARETGTPAATATANTNLFGSSTASSMFAPASTTVVPTSSASTFSSASNVNANPGGSAFIFGTAAATTPNAPASTATTAASFGQTMFGQPAAAKPQIGLGSVSKTTTSTATFGGFGAATATFGAAAAPIASAPTTTFGQAAATAAPFAFGAGAPSAVSTPSLFAFGAVTGSDEPQAKKMVGQSPQQKQPAFAFGATNNNTADAKTPFSFSASTPTSFNFSAQQSQPQQQQSTNLGSSQPYTFGAPSALTTNPSGAAVFSFGSGNPETNRIGHQYQHGHPAATESARSSPQYPVRMMQSAFDVDKPPQQQPNNNIGSPPPNQQHTTIATTISIMQPPAARPPRRFPNNVWVRGGGIVPASPVVAAGPATIAQRALPTQSTTTPTFGRFPAASPKAVRTHHPSAYRINRLPKGGPATEGGSVAVKRRSLE